MRVAQVRGKSFHQAPYSTVWIPASWVAGPSTEETDISWPEKLLEEVREWLGFEELDDYLIALAVEGPAIFDRATY